jgi:hypothetical protein
MDALTELLEYRKPHGASPMLNRAYRFHRKNPEVLDFLVRELRAVRTSGWKRTSLGSLWHFMRWTLLKKRRAHGETFVVTQNLSAYYSRFVAILHPEFNGFFEMAKSRADEDLGTRLEPSSKNHMRGYIRRLLWADGTEIEHGWRPTTPHEPQPVSRRKPVSRSDDDSRTGGGDLLGQPTIRENEAGNP